MQTIPITRYAADQGPAAFQAFEDAWHHRQCCYSLQNCVLMGLASPEEMMQALQKAAQVCALAGIPARHHFRKIYLFDPATGATHIDWLMSKKGFNMVVIQSSLLNERVARWLWALTDL
ncbi:MAG: hypothetical protein ABIQ93_05475 [Saprospiraceae bacterium]